MASQTQLSVVSNNISNAATPGYSREAVVLEVNSPGSKTGMNSAVGQGVMVTGITRRYDALLQNQINLAQQDYGRSNTLSQYLSSIDQLFNEAQDIGLAGPLNDFFNAWQEVANNPQGLTERNLLLQKADILISSAQQLEQGITDSIGHVNTNITSDTDQINDLASRIALLNGQITQMESGSSVASAIQLRDKRDQALKELNNLIETSSWEDPNNGAITVTVGQRNLVSANNTNTLTATYTSSGSYDLKLDGLNITSKISKGEMGGLLTVQENLKTDLHDLRKLVASLTNQVNLQHVQGYDLDGNAGTNFFDPLQLTVVKNAATTSLTATITDNSLLTLDEYAVGFVDDGSGGFNYQITNSATGAVKTSGAYNPAGTTVNLEGIRFVLSGAVTAEDNFTVSPLTSAIQDFERNLTDPRHIAASSGAATIPGNNANALAIADIINTQVSALDSGSLADYYQTLIGQIGGQSKTASDNLTFANNFLNQLTSKRDSISGVNMDEEAADLIRFQRSFQAAARVLDVADKLFQTLLNL